MNIFNFLKKQKLIIFLIFILFSLLLIRSVWQKKEADKEIEPPPPLEKKERPESEFEPEKSLPQKSPYCPSCEIEPSPSQKTEKVKTPADVSAEIDQDKFPYDHAGDALKQALEEKPWLFDLPIQEKNYAIDYMGEEKGFRVLMKIDIASPLSREQQIENIKTQAPKKLEEIGVDLNKEKVYYTFIP